MVEHGKHPRNFGPLPGADRVAQGVNPLCGDELTLRLRTAGGRIGEISFEGMGCAVSMASASLMTLAVKGSGPDEVAALAALVQELVKGAPVPASRLGDLAALAGVSRFPARVKCALLPWRALAAAFSGEPAPVSTE